MTRYVEPEDNRKTTLMNRTNLTLGIIAWAGSLIALLMMTSHNRPIDWTYLLGFGTLAGIGTIGGFFMSLELMTWHEDRQWRKATKTWVHYPSHEAWAQAQTEGEADFFSNLDAARQAAMDRHPYQGGQS